MSSVTRERKREGFIRVRECLGEREGRERERVGEWSDSPINGAAESYFAMDSVFGKRESMGV